MENTSVDVQAGADGSLVVQPHGAMNFDTAVTLRQILVYAVRKVRPVRLVLDLSDVSAMDAINLGTLAALCDLADDHHVAVSMENYSATVGGLLTAAGVPPQRLRSETAA
ncbi:anti-anti-sigma factor [Krasilnikovia cinnamomea]|uniref:Anti-anti-sigma factor n=1 Tax=Krasilnikovia cinnamomea TaxID=349313 RepID=A0A4Q7ZJ04_9ACTN|nr:STAS domain-containing protein [Krasilnikovia cinnamomea]RZU50838.1 anti-anti-sigma factor [Krasilnikovia cinnamomea]